jgi:hypothetical protein
MEILDFVEMLVAFAAAVLLFRALDWLDRRRIAAARARVRK